MTIVKKELKYSAEHEWINDETPARVGITDFAADQLGEVVFAELPEPGDKVVAGEECGELESTKSVSELISPVTGTVVESNQNVVESPELINEDPYGKAWLFTVEVESEGELLTPEEYAEQTGGSVS